MSTEVGPAAGGKGAHKASSPFRPSVNVVLVRTNPPATETEVDDHVCLYAPRAREVLVLNGSAGVIWAATDRPRPVDDVVAEVAAVFGLPVADVVAEVRTTLARFTEAGLLTEVVEG